MIDYRNRREIWLRNRWPQIRAKGIWRYIFWRGLVGTGGFVFSFFTVVDVLTSNVPHHVTQSDLIKSAVACAFFGFVWGMLSWWLRNYAYTELSKSESVQKK